MTEPHHTFYNLEFSRGADFWAECGGSECCAFLMPVIPASEFLAFGVLESSKRVHFVARGRMKEDLAAFIEGMTRSGARVELYVRAPVPRSILKRYLSGPPIEHQETEEPPEPPVRGLITDPSTPHVGTLDEFLWPQGDFSSRRVVITPTHDPSEFFALGLWTASHQVIFKLRGSVGEQLHGFVSRMVKDHARVELSHKLTVL